MLKKSLIAIAVLAAFVGTNVVAQADFLDSINRGLDTIDRVEAEQQKKAAEAKAKQTAQQQRAAATQQRINQRIEKTKQTQKDLKENVSIWQKFLNFLTGSSSTTTTK